MFKLFNDFYIHFIYFDAVGWAAGMESSL